MREALPRSRSSALVGCSARRCGVGCSPAGRSACRFELCPMLLAAQRSASTRPPTAPPPSPSTIATLSTVDTRSCRFLFASRNPPRNFVFLAAVLTAVSLPFPHLAAVLTAVRGRSVGH